MRRPNGRGLEPRAEIAPRERQDLSEDGRRIGLGEADREAGLADAGLVSGCRGEGRA
jgi:hypothetical protein